MFVGDEEPAKRPASSRLGRSGTRGFREVFKTFGVAVTFLLVVRRAVFPVTEDLVDGVEEALRRSGATGF